VELAGCCLNAALRDWARFGQLHLQEGEWRGRRVLPEGWVASATRHPPGEPDDATRHDYRYQWWVFGDGTYTAEGVYGQFIWVHPERGVVIAKTSVWPVAWSRELAEDAFGAFAAIADHLDGVAPAQGV
jgi:CubicO group peptidase (beta-lactamase class C family)